MESPPTRIGVLFGSPDPVVELDRRVAIDSGHLSGERIDRMPADVLPAPVAWQATRRCA